MNNSVAWAVRVGNLAQCERVARRYASDRLEQAFWDFDALHKANYRDVNPSLPGPMSERDAFKAVVRNIVLSHRIARRFVASLGDELRRRMDDLLATKPLDAGKGEDLAKWMGDNFHFLSPKTPKGQKELKSAAEKLHWWLKAGIRQRQDPEGARATIEDAWKDVESKLPDLVRYFSDEGGKVVPKELKLGGNTYLNLAGFEEKKLKEYANRLEAIFGSLKGWRTKAVAGGFTVALASPREFRGTSSGKYKSSEDTLYVKATPDVLKRGGGTYASFEYILVHEIGHRWEYKNRVPMDFDRAEWQTTKYSTKEGEAFAELFALGHFDLKGPWDQGKVERFEKAMTGG